MTLSATIKAGAFAADKPCPPIDRLDHPPNAIWAIVVTYNPEPDALMHLIDALALQVATVLVVDNASALDVGSLLANSPARNIAVKRMEENFGIAAAQNVGIDEAMRSGAAFIYLSDQDSVPSSSMVAQLSTVFASTQGRLAAAVGPATVDGRTGRVSFFVVEHSGLPRRWQPPLGCERAGKALDVGFLIASGTLMSVEAIKKIGGMRSQYFIDHVDTEWCFRAKTAGYSLLGVPEARLVHELGDSVETVWFFGSRQVMYHSPLRDYYMFRNTLLMLRDVPMSWMWRFYLLFRLLQFAGYFLVFAQDRVVRFRRMVLGLRHGLSGQGGRLDPDTGICQVLPRSPLEPR